jgi:hypothetical protein
MGNRKKTIQNRQPKDMGNRKKTIQNRQPKDMGNRKKTNKAKRTTLKIKKMDNTNSTKKKPGVLAGVREE